MKSNLPTRRLIPKWRPVAATLRTPDAAPIAVNKADSLVLDHEEFDRAIRLWKETKTPGALGDLLSFGVHHELGKKVAALGQDALRIPSSVTGIQRLLIHDLAMYHGLIPTPPPSEIQTGAHHHPFEASIRAVRALLKSAPENALALLDYAQFQAAVGRLERAERAIRTAVALRPDNRTVLRTAARFFVHIGKSDVGHSLIRRHARTASDPWLMATEIALADVTQSQSMFLSKGRRFLLDHKSLPASQLTELAGALSMAELNSGNLKRAREMQRQALLAPNDNVIAQAVEFRSRLGLQLEGPTIERAMSASNEARVLQAWYDAAPDDAVTAALEWHRIEPFSSRPVQLLSTLYAYRRELDLAQQWIRVGLLADPVDKSLLINLAYVQVLSQDYPAAKEVIRRLKSMKIAELDPYIFATQGLQAYQLGEFAQGDDLYRAAIAALDKARQPQFSAYCRVNQTLAAIENNHPDRDVILAMTNAALKSNMSYDSAMLIKVRSNLSIEASKMADKPGRRLSQWVFDPKRNTLTNKPGVTPAEAERLIIEPAISSSNE